MYNAKIPDYMTKDAIVIILKKKNCCDYVTTCLKSIFIRCTIGYTDFERFNDILKMQVFSEFDIIVGITSGGWIIAQMLSQQFKKPCIKLKYSRYNDKSVSEKAHLFFKGKNPQNDLISKNKIELSEKIPPHSKVLLVDDSVGSGATLRHCYEFLKPFCQQIKTFVIVAPDTNIVDYSITSKHFLIFPWGLDV